MSTAATAQRTTRNSSSINPPTPSKQPQPQPQSQPAAQAVSPAPSDPFENIDPTLHEATLNSVTDHESNRLTDFAQHVLGGATHVDDAASLLAFSAGEDGSLFPQPAHQPFTELLEGAEPGEGRREDEENKDGGFEHAAVDEEILGEGDLGDFNEELAEDHNNENHNQIGSAPPPPDRRGGRKRRREGEEDENGEPLDPIRLKKDSHKEVERRRRENINDGINEIAKHIPGGTSKLGKGGLLRKAAEYLASLTKRVEGVDEEVAKRELEKGDLETQVHALKDELEHERRRVYNYEKSWQEAEERAATSLFELERLKTELSELKKKYEPDAE